MTYITCKLLGGLGNQLFQIATTLATAMKYNLTPVFKKEEPESYEYAQRHSYWNNIFRNLNVINDLDTSRFAILHEDYSKRYMKFSNPSSDILLNGYFQCSKYFNNYKSEIKQLFKLTEEDDLIVDKYIAFLRQKFPNKKLVGIQVRRTDYVTLGWELSPEYYNDSQQRYSSDTEFICFSDDIEWCKLNIKNIYPVEEKFEDYIELFILSKMDSTIISNSSFGWWGTFLNNNISFNIAPNPWFKTINYDPCIYDDITMKVSVIIPTYNRYDFLIDSVNSVIKQSYPNIEIIIVNDCSTDIRYKKLDDLYLHNSNIKIIHLPINMRQKHNVSAAQGLTKNEGLKIAKGQWIAFLDDDDLWIDSEKIYKQLTAMTKYNCKLCSTNMFYKNSKVPFFTPSFYIGEKMDTFTYKFNRKHVEEVNYINNSTCIVHKDIIGEFSSGKDEDYRFWLECLKKTDGIYIQDFTTEYDSNHGNGQCYN